MFETTFRYTSIFEENANDVYYQIISHKLKRQAKGIIIALLPFLLLFAYILPWDYMKGGDNMLDIALDIWCLSLTIFAMSISTFAWRSFFFYINRKIYFDRFKDNSPINIKISSDEAYIIYQSQKILLLPKYPLFQTNKNKHLRVFVYDMQNYIFFTMLNTHYFIYIDKEQFPADTIKELQENLKNIYGKCYVKKY